MKQIELFLILLTSIYTLVLPDTMSIGEASLYTYILLLVLDVIRRKSFNVLHVWLAAFIFIVCSNIILYQPNRDAWSTIFIINANNILLLGYFMGGEVRKKNVPLIDYSQSTASGCRNKKAELYILVLLAIYVYTSFMGAVQAFLFGRITDGDAAVEDSQFALSEVLSSIGMVFPAIAAYYYRIYRKKSVWFAWLICSPIFLMLFMGGTRYPLLFALLGFVIGGRIMDVNNITKKNLVVILISASLVIGATQLMKNFRSRGFEEFTSAEVASSEAESLAQKIAGMMSSEFIIECVNFEHKYFEEHPHTYGVSTGFIFYFWIPRAIWPDKPTQLGYWMIRKESAVSEAQNNSYGFIGEPYADFGYFSLILMFFFGIGLKRIESFQIENMKNVTPKLIIAAMMFPYVFFFVRSPVTSTTRLFGMIIWYIAFIKISGINKSYKKV